ERIVNLNVVLGEAVAIAQIERRCVAHDRERIDFAETFEAEEDEILIAAQRTSDGSTVLMSVMFSAWEAGLIILRGVCVEKGVVKIFEQIAVPGIGAALQRGDDGAAAGAAVLSVVAIGDDLEFLDGVDIGRKLPASREADGSAVEEELVRADDAAVD